MIKNLNGKESANVSNALNTKPPGLLPLKRKYGSNRSTAVCFLWQVSNGAECIMISKKFFLTHCSDAMKRRLLVTVRRATLNF